MTERPPVTTPDEVAALVRRFADNRADYLRSDYKETRLRREFIDPLFAALGWDVENTAGYAEAYKDVVHEDTVRIGGRAKAPDYSFRVGGTRKFFTEAKKPSVRLKNDAESAYQLRRYAWNAKLPLSILTNFDEFAVYDTREAPRPSQRAATTRLLYLTSADYLTQWDKIASVFSRDAVLRGSFDRYALVTTGRRGTAEVDEAFLADIERWREDLALALPPDGGHLVSEDVHHGKTASGVHS